MEGFRTDPAWQTFHLVMTIDYTTLAESWRRPPGVFILSEVGGAAGAAVRALTERFDPKLAAALPPHVTFAGSSGVGPVAASTPLPDLRGALAPIAADTAPLSLAFGNPIRFMQTDIIVLPLDPHGAIRVLHDRIAASGLAFGPARFTFTPHVTLSFFRTLSRDDAHALLSVRIDDPVVIDHLLCSLTNEPMPPRTLLDLPLLGRAQ